jgi:hypothetical protein
VLSPFALPVELHNIRDFAIKSIIFRAVFHFGGKFTKFQPIEGALGQPKGTFCRNAHEIKGQLHAPGIWKQKKCLRLK